MNGAATQNRTVHRRLQIYRFTLKLWRQERWATPTNNRMQSAISLAWGMVGEIGFEPTASCSQSRRATKLRHSPKNGCPSGARSHNLPVNSRMLYQLSHRAIINILLALPTLYLMAVVCYREPGVVGFEPTNT